MLPANQRLKSIRFPDTNPIQPFPSCFEHILRSTRGNQTTQKFEELIEVGLHSDLALHGMGRNLADGVSLSAVGGLQSRDPGGCGQDQIVDRIGGALVIG
jgi:hypothetical protein